MSTRRLIVTILLSILTVLVLVMVVLIGVRKKSAPSVPNPDPGHIHVDFEIWTSGKQMDISDPKFMTTEAQEALLQEGDPRKFIHLHDGNGHIIHVHKIGETLGDFLTTLGLSVASDQPEKECLFVESSEHPFTGCESGPLRLFVKGQQIATGTGSVADYVLHDLDKILLTDAATDAQLQLEMARMTDEACLYSRTCPNRGPPPQEGCIADPSVKCRE